MNILHVFHYGDGSVALGTIMSIHHSDITELCGGVIQHILWLKQITRLPFAEQAERFCAFLKENLKDIFSHELL